MKTTMIYTMQVEFIRLTKSVFEVDNERCEDELRSTLEDWILLGLKLGHPLPVIAEIDLNREMSYEPLGAV